MEREMGGRFKRKEISVYLRLIHVEVYRKQQNSVKQLYFNKKINEKKKKNRNRPPDRKKTYSYQG